MFFFLRLTGLDYLSSSRTPTRAFNCVGEKKEARDAANQRKGKQSSVHICTSIPLTIARGGGGGIRTSIRARERGPRCRPKDHQQRQASASLAAPKMTTTESPTRCTPQALRRLLSAATGTRRAPQRWLQCTLVTPRPARATPSLLCFDLLLLRLAVSLPRALASVGWRVQRVHVLAPWPA